MQPLTAVLVVLIIIATLHLKHYLLDYVWQTRHMLIKSSKRTWVGPLSSHALIHAGGSFVALLPFALHFRVISPTFLICVMELAIHWIIDAIQCQCFRYNVFNRRYWAVLGLDQYLHSLTYLAMSGIWMIAIIE